MTNLASISFLLFGLFSSWFGANENAKEENAVFKKETSSYLDIKANYGKGGIYYTGEQLFLNDEEIDLDKIPEMEVLYAVSKEELGKWAKLFIAVKIEESGVDGKHSGLARVRNNLVGMRVPKRRRTYCVGSTSTNYAIYNNWFESMQDFRVFIEIKERKFKRKHGHSPKDEHEFVDHLYGSYNIYSKWHQDVHSILRNFKYDKAE